MDRTFLIRPGVGGSVSASSWLLTSDERDNPATRLDYRHADGLTWTTGNEVTALIHGHAYFPELVRCVKQMRAGDLLLFTDWRGDPDQVVDSDGLQISRLLCDAAGRGVTVKGLLWRSHLDRLGLSEKQNRHLGEEVEAAGGEALLDMRVRPWGSHHQKFVVLRHPGRPELDVAFVGGIDLCHSRFDGPEHAGDPQVQPMAKVFSRRPPWHDIQLAIRGPAVGDVEASFRERWEDPTPLTRNPVHRLADAVRRDDERPNRLPPQLPDPAPRGTMNVQVLRTYPVRRQRYPFAPNGERSIAHAYTKAIANARHLIYLEDQYLWAPDVIACFADALRRQPELRLIAVVPHYPDQDGRWSKPPNLVGRQLALDSLRAAGGDRVAVYGIENAAGTPIYVHAKVCVIDDFWVSVGSDNVNRRSWTHDSELSCAVIDERRVFARELRLALAREHLERGPDDEADLLDPRSAYDEFAASARALSRWYAGGRRGPRPPGRIRPYEAPRLGGRTLAWATPLYRSVYDPDGRPRGLRRAGRF
jgi:phosphatidylserine/phosphatidylglycerophosphate/cardiolipin synthase-like enzyme